MLSPDNQPGRAYDWVVNQAGHAAIVGFGLALPFIWLPPLECVMVASAIYFVFWEWMYQIETLGSKDWKDSVADTANVAAGSAMAAAVGWNPAFWGIWFAWLVMLAIGAGFRK